MKTRVSISVPDDVMMTASEGLWLETQKTIKKLEQKVARLEREKSKLKYDNEKYQRAYAAIETLVSEWRYEIE